MKVCPCGFTRFPDGERFCLHDSAVLVEEDDIMRLGHENLEPVWIQGLGVAW